MSDVLVQVYGTAACEKTGAYLAFLRERGVAHTFLDVSANAQAAEHLGTLFPDGKAHFPTIVLGGRRLRNPDFRQLEKELYRSGALMPVSLHEPHAQRFVRYMRPTDAFVSYGWHGDVMVLTHIEVDPVHRGTGLGARLARDVFKLVRATGRKAAITCPFLRRVASASPDDSAYFGVPAITRAAGDAR